MDNRMQWITLFEKNHELASSSKDANFTKYEICSEVRIPGVLNYDNGNLLCGIIGEKDKNGLYSYSVIIKQLQNPQTIEFDKNKYSKNGYCFPKEIIGEFIAIFSVYFQARFFLKSTTHGELTPYSIETRFDNDFYYIKPSKHLNADMFSSKERNWAEKDGLKKFLDKIKSIDQKYHQNLIISFDWYLEAIKNIGADKELFYIKMTSCVESLLNFTECPRDQLDGKIQNLLNKFNEQEKIEINNWLNNRNIQKKFTKFITSNSKNFFKGGNRRAKHCYIKKDDLTKYLKRIYKARSQYLHNGKPMYISDDLIMNEANSWHIDPSLGMYMDRKIFKEKEKLPRMLWFEKIVNHCIKNFVEENAR